MGSEVDQIGLQPSDNESVMDLSDLIHNGERTRVVSYLKSLLENPGEISAALSQTDRFGRTNTELLVMLNYGDCIEEIVEFGKGVNEDYGKGYTLAHYAALWNRYEIIRHLYLHGAQLDLCSIFGESPKDIAIRYEHKEICEAMEWIALRENFLEYLQKVKKQLKMSKSKYSTRRKKKITEVLLECEKWIMENGNSTIEELKTKRDELDAYLDQMNRETTK